MRADHDAGLKTMHKSKKGLKKSRGRSGHAATAATCPFCGEAEELTVDPGGGDAQVYVEDCAVCCRPRVVHVEPGGQPGEVRVWLERGD
jgi:hypothetical protein